jgi:hypothetical protein
MHISPQYDSVESLHTTALLRRVEIKSISDGLFDGIEVVRINEHRPLQFAG